MKKAVFIFFLSVCVSFIYGQNADAIVGKYLKEDGESKIEFYKSGNTYSGKVVWLKEPNDKNGNPKKDVNNPDKSLRERQLMGIITISGLKFDGDGRYVDGKAYRPVEGDEVKIKVKVNDNGTINVTGSKYGFSKTKK
jgi:uncharacterized protein (DUF2147 family)